MVDVSLSCWGKTGGMDRPKDGVLIACLIHSGNKTNRKVTLCSVESTHFINHGLLKAEFKQKSKPHNEFLCFVSTVKINA